MSAVAIAAVFIARLLDPIAGLLALVAGYFSRAWWQVAIASLIVTAIVELILYSMQYTRSFHTGRFLIGVFAAGVWCAAAFAFKTWRSKRPSRRRRAKQ